MGNTQEKDLSKGESNKHNLILGCSKAYEIGSILKIEQIFQVTILLLMHSISNIKMLFEILPRSKTSIPRYGIKGFGIIIVVCPA